MSTVLRFTPNLARHLDCPDARVTATTLRDALDQYFKQNPKARGYVLDDQGIVRKHVAIFVNQTLIADRIHLTDKIAEGDEIFVMQALSGG